MTARRVGFTPTPRRRTCRSVILCSIPVIIVPRLEPQEMPWGERVAYLRDPEGTMVLTVQEPLPDS